MKDLRTERIYLTYKARMTSEARLRATGSMFHLLIIWYSLWLIITSLIELTGEYSVRYYAVSSIAFSVALLAVSIYTHGENFQRKADEFRECYLALQSIYLSSDSIDDKIRSYFATLKHYPNQSNRDYDNMLLESWMHGQELENANGAVVITKKIIARVLFRRLFFIGFFGVLVMFPPISIAFLVTKNG